MASAERLDQQADYEVASKVLRRAQVSKMTRQLQNRLALANVKIKHGWEKLSIDSLEPQIDMELKRKRRGSTNTTPSDTSSIVSDRFHPAALDSSPLAPMFSDDVRRSGSSNGFNNKRTRYQLQTERPASSSHMRTKVRTKHTKATSWKSSYHLPASSPAYHNRHSVNFPASHVPSLSFVSETTVADEVDPSLSSEDDDADLPVHSFRTSTGPQIHSSPPRTPPPDRARSAHLRQKPFSNLNSHDNNASGEEGAADLLMFLAASPSPAQPTPSRTLTRTPQIQAPSTPPAKATPLPPSMMNTPGGASTNFLGLGSVTPSMSGFNFADYVNVTPSPAQAAWRTPGPSKTPLAAREARRRLNFDSLVPPEGSSSMADGKAHGLGMELGGALVSSQ
ncbi:hypothetical protein NA57DRAFT_55952 [Rhizodiscina lignyota]|uniref:Uncharacterized protein n=1 Tax=Rhizodiscina lignyota TaxID=1504668 RepID=A0A9P4IIR8_9PEZI|nr:hypothetical protein NA57DRAFT_55952 [Rhizodiscina lignyota]